MDQEIPFKVAQKRYSQVSEGIAYQGYNKSPTQERYSDLSIPDSKSQYKLSLSCKYKVEFGQTVAVVGNIPELGMWKNNQLCQLKWTEGDIWKTTEPIVTSRPHFMYKYVLLDEGKN
jgi:hypothetical protein